MSNTRVHRHVPTTGPESFWLTCVHWAEQRTWYSPFYDSFEAAWAARDKHLEQHSAGMFSPKAVPA